MKWSWLLLVLAGCFPKPSQELACVETKDCKDGRVCESGFCVVGGGSGMPDAGAPDAPSPPPDADLLAACRNVAGYTFEPTTNSFYRRVNVDDEWMLAKADCANDVPGKSHLIVSSSAAEEAFIRANPGWIGLTDQVDLGATEGAFKTLTGEAAPPLTQPPWGPGQPDNGGGDEDCVEMRTSDGRLNDIECVATNTYVCECDGRPDTL